MRRLVVVRGDEGPEGRVDVGEAGDGAEVIEAARAQRAPEALHLAARPRVVGLGVHERDAEAGAAEPQQLAAVGRAVVEVEDAGCAVAAQRPDEEAEHVGLQFGVVGFDGNDAARRVVEQCMDAQRLVVTPDEERGPVAHIAVPERHGPLGLPRQAGVRARAVAQRDTVEAVLDVEPAHRRG